MVDVLKPSQLGGGWEEIWRSLASVPFSSRLVAHALPFNNLTTIAKFAAALAPHPLRRDRHPGKLVAGWNLVPPVVLERAWREVEAEATNKMAQGAKF